MNNNQLVTQDSTTHGGDLTQVHPAPHGKRPGWLVGLLLRQIAKIKWRNIQLSADNRRMKAELELFHKVVSSAQEMREAAEKATMAHQQLATYMSRATAVELGTDYKVGHSRRIPQHD
jgi:hypothetical protein